MAEPYRMNHCTGSKNRWAAALVLAIGCICAFISPAAAFTANSLTITINTSGDAIAVFSYTLEGFVENAIPESMLEEELKKGLTTSSDPPEVVTFNRSGATLLLKQFAQTTEVENGTEYLTAMMDFSKAEIALKDSALSYAVTADFSPQITTVIFPDGYGQVFDDSSTLPPLTHTVIDPEKQAAITAATGSLQVTTSPENAGVLLDSVYIGASPGTFAGISPGQHRVTIEHTGFLPAERTVTIGAGKSTLLLINLTRAAPISRDDGSSLPGLPGFTVALAGLAWCGAAALTLFRLKR